MTIDIEWLKKPGKLWSRFEVLNQPSPVPNKPGIYAWYFKEIPPRIDIAGCIQFNGLTLLYIGISPSREGSSQTLRKRIYQHLRGNADSSTLRLTLGSLLRKKLQITLRRRANVNHYEFGEGEQVLNSWLAENAFVTWKERDEPWEKEGDLISIIIPPLNLEENEKNPNLSFIKQARKEAKNEAELID